MQAKAVARSVEIWSSVEYGGFGNALAKYLCSRGVPTSLRFEVPQSEYWGATGLGARLLMRSAAYGRYPLRLLSNLWLANPRPIPIVSTNTFYAPFIAALLGPGSTPVINWVLDLYPDVLALDGQIARKGTIDRALTLLASATFRHSAASVFLGERLLSHAKARYGHVQNAWVIPVGADGTPFRKNYPQQRSGPLEILYSGNLGRMHELETLEAVLCKRLPENLRITFRANGVGFRRLQATLLRCEGSGPQTKNPRQVVLGGSLGTCSWVPAMLAADVALVTLRSGAEALVMPSKTYSAMVAGQAILAVCPSNSDLADLVRKHDCGWIVEPGNKEGLSEAFARIASSPIEVLHKRRAAFEAGHKYYDQSAISARWLELLSSLPGSCKREI
jgi:colanic acid biosynthesis glycosyl transferase WcaI